MKPHLLYAHRFWRDIVHPGDTIIDATVGNGYDTLYLAQLLNGSGFLYGYDIQPEALSETERRLQELSQEQKKIIQLKLKSHDEFEERNVKLIVYNLGYLPRGNKKITTQCETTLKSLQKALQISACISITCYPGHEEGAKEEGAILNFLKTLPSDQWLVSHFRWINRPLSPSLIWIQVCV